MLELIPSPYTSWYVRLITSTCVTAILLSVALNFIEARHIHAISKKQKSIVATGTMLLFFLFYFSLLSNQRFSVTIPLPWLSFMVLHGGLGLMVLGCAINILGRMNLRHNWANQVTIYNDHELVQKGTYKIVRHPLYASLIWMFVAGSMVYSNYAALLATLLIFIPFMYYRAQQEEKLLRERFREYNLYQKNTGMFFPKIVTHKNYGNV